MAEGNDHLSENLTQILGTRAAITEKLEQLERRAQEVVQDASSAVVNIIDRVHAVADETLEKTRQAFDPRYQMDRHPWFLLGGAIVMGFMVAQALSSSNDRGERTASKPPVRRTTGENVIDEFTHELDRAKAALIESGRSLLRGFVQQAFQGMTQSFTARRSQHLRKPTHYPQRGRNGAPFARDH